MIGPYDILIAAQALSENLTLVTDNVDEFGRIPDLKIENWLEWLNRPPSSFSRKVHCPNLSILGERSKMSENLTLELWLSCDQATLTSKRHLRCFSIRSVGEVPSGSSNPAKESGSPKIPSRPMPDPLRIGSGRESNRWGVQRQL